MTLPYKRNFTKGRQSEQFLNDQLHQIHKALENINYRKNENKGIEPESILDGALWFDKTTQNLMYYDLPSNTWRCVFSPKFQKTDYITNITMPASPVEGQLWIYNGVLMYFDGSQWQAIKALQQDNTQWSNAAFEDYMLVSPLNPADYNAQKTELDIDLLLKSLNDKGDSHKEINFEEPAEEKWSAGDDFSSAAPEKYEIPEDAVSQYVIPNLDTDRIFLGHKYDESYNPVSKVCFQYPTKVTANTTVSGIHMNPGKLTGIKKRLIKVDRLNPSIEASAYNTEFYGFRADRTGGELLLESKEIDKGDYVSNGDHIILSRSAAQNYDYVMAITFTFASVKSDGAMEKHKASENKTSFYVANMQAPIAVHADGFMVEEAAYHIDAQQKIVSFDEDVSDIDIDMWAPYKKDYGYIREVDYDGRAIIHLHTKMETPLVFVAGTLIHPVFGGIEIDGRTIYVPNKIPGIDNMKNMPWCVVDVNDYFDDGKVEVGETIENDGYIIGLNSNNYFSEDHSDYYLVDGDFMGTYTDGLKDFLIGYGYLGEYGNSYIKYDTSRVGVGDGVLLFVNGLMVCPDEIVRDPENGMIFVPGLELGSEYVLLRDPDGRIYDSTSLLQAYGVGYLSDSIVYMNGKLLANENCVATTDTPETERDREPSHNEIKLFIVDEAEDIKEWKIFDHYNYEWIPLEEKAVADAEYITSAYINLLTSVRIDVEHSDKDDITIFAFRFANAKSGVYKTGRALYQMTDPDTGIDYWTLGSDTYAPGGNNLNLYKNGVKLFPGLHYKETDVSNQFVPLVELSNNDCVRYIVEPIERGESKAYELIVMDNDDAAQPNIYKKPDNSPDFYPGRLTVYINGLRLSNKDWTLIDNNHIMLNFGDYISCGSGDNYIEETYAGDGKVFSVAHTYPDYIMVEIRKDYDRKEATFNYRTDDGHEVYLDKNGIPLDILDCEDDILIYWNGQYTGLSRRSSSDYRIDKYKSCITLLEPEFLATINSDLATDNKLTFLWR